MKLKFALSLSFDGISLLLRQVDGWALVGETALDVPDLAAALADLRAKAPGAGPEKLRCKLVIPADQIKFISLPTLTSMDTDAAIRDALDGATPYAVDDLVYDWSEANGSTCAAAVARETLLEAETFARENGFDPVSFVAAPQLGFQGEVQFGLSESAKASLAPGEQVEQDKVAAVATVPLAAPEPEATTKAPEIAFGSRRTATPENIAPKPAPPQAPARSTETPNASQKPAPQKPLQRPAPPASPGFSTMRASRNDAPQGAKSAPKLNGAERTNQPPATPLDAASPARQSEPATRISPAPPPPMPAPLAPGLSTANNAPNLGAATEPASPTMGATPKFDVAPTPPTFKSAPVPEDVAPPSETTAKPDTNSAGVATTLAAAKSRFSSATFPSLPKFGRAPKSKVKPAPAIVTTQAPDEAAVAVAPEVPIQETAAKRGGLLRGKKAKAQTPEAGALENERQRMTVFGARKPVAIGGKPRFLGLMLTATLLIFLAGVAAWASVYIEDGIARLFGRQSSPMTIASAPRNSPISTNELSASAPDSSAGVGVEVASLARGTAPIDNAVRQALRQPRVTDNDDLDPDEVEARYAATGIWQMAPQDPGLPGMISLDDIYFASIDSVVNAYDAVSLPTLRDTLTDVALRPQRLPPPAGARFKFDDRGMIAPTLDGVVTPEGYSLFLGAPPTLPPARPGSTTQQTPEATTPDETKAEMLRLAGLPPRARPEGLVEANERGQLAGRSLMELATLRPKARPASLKEAEEAERVNEPPSALVQTLSPIPRKRPGNITTIVKRAKLDDDDGGGNNPSTARVRQVKPKTVTPSIPSRSSVAKAATEKNAIRLNRVNLIGVYGKPSSRRALIRLASGRYQKVKVGDRIDGGKVAAIGEGELRYTKGGRSVTLTMPKT